MKNNTILKLHTYICQVGFLMYFCMKKREYVLTAVLITLFFNDISSSKFMTYFIGAMVAVITLLWGLALNKK